MEHSSPLSGGHLATPVPTLPALRPFRVSLSELSGALADVGVLVPLAFALIAVNGMASTNLFFGLGVAYVITGIVYRLPLPVQPLKVVCAIALTRQLPASMVSASGWVLGAILLLIAVTDSARWLAHFFPKPIVRGLQLGVGIMLLRSGISVAAHPEVIRSGPESVLHLGPWVVPVGWLFAAVALVLMLSGAGRRWGAASLPAIVLGVPLVLALSGAGPSGATFRFGLTLPAPSLPRLPDLATAFVLLVLPQIPLTLGNAVFATADTARTYFGPDARLVSPRRLLTTTGVCQVLSSLFGGVPVCHGSGGLTAHYKLGARTGAAPIIVGSLCLVLALFLDNGALAVLALIPFPILGALLAFAGIQHGVLARDVRGWREVAVAAVTATVGLGSGNLAVGMVAGVLLCSLLRLPARIGPDRLAWPGRTA